MKIKGWDMTLPYVMAAYQSSRHEVSKYTPDYLMLEQKVHTPVDIVYGCPQNPSHRTMMITRKKWENG